MIFPAVTAVYAALFAILFVGLSGWVIAGRVGSNALFGDGGDDGLAKRVRSHANFTENVPLALILIGLLEAAGAGSTLIHALLIVLLVARILHPIGMFAPVNSPRQFACRGGGILGTLLVLIAAAIALLVRLA